MPARQLVILSQAGRQLSSPCAGRLSVWATPALPNVRAQRPVPGNSEDMP